MERVEYSFTQDWFHWAPALLKGLVPLLPARKKFLELGAFEGRATVWMLEHMLEAGGTIVCVDTWEGGEEHAALGVKMDEAEARFNANIKLYPDQEKKVVTGKGKTTEIIPQLYSGSQFDFIYVDASHVAKDVLTDACMSWPLLKPNGIMVFDDYMWGEAKDILHRPKLAIDAFVNIFAEEIEIISMGYQMAVKKK